MIMLLEQSIKFTLNILNSALRWKTGFNKDERNWINDYGFIWQLKMHIKFSRRRNNDALVTYSWIPLREHISEFTHKIPSFSYI